MKQEEQKKLTVLIHWMITQHLDMHSKWVQFYQWKWKMMGQTAKKGRGGIENGVTMNDSKWRRKWWETYQITS